jgi:hypothetical protein
MRRMSLIASCSAALMLLSAPLLVPGRAAAEPVPIAEAGTGLSAPAAVVETPDGGIWVADELRGVCRVDLTEPATVVPSPWCGEPTPEPAEVDEDTEDDDSEDESTEPSGHVGPSDASGLVFDARTNNFYASDRASSGGAIWRLHLNSDGTIDDGQIIASLGDRVDALTLGPASGPGTELAVFFITKRGGDIMRVDKPADTTPQLPALVGTAAGDEMHDITATEDALYVADGGLTKYTFNDSGSLSPSAVAGFENQNLTVTAVTADVEHNRLYVGSSNPILKDGFGEDILGEDVVGVLNLSSGQAEIYEQGFTGVTALGVGAEGALLVADDPIVATGAEGTIGEGRLWSVALQALNRPAVSLTAWPSAISSDRTVSFSFESRPGTAFECRLDDGTFEDCPGDTPGSVEYRDLPDGAYRFQVRATEDDVAGLPAAWRFMLDRTAPNVTVLRPDDDDFVEGGPAPRISFRVDEPGVRYRCSIDDAPFQECESGNPIEGLSVGTHVLRVVGVDRAGNESDPDADDAWVKIKIRERKRPPAPADPPPSRPDAPTVPPAAAAPVLPFAVETAIASRGPAARRPWLGSFTVRMSSRRRRLHVRFRAAPEAASAKIWLVRPSGRVVLRRSLAMRRGRWNHVHVTLTRAERRRLKPGRHIAIAVPVSSRGTSGRAQTRGLRVPPTHRG